MTLVTAAGIHRDIAAGYISIFAGSKSATAIFTAVSDVAARVNRLDSEPVDGGDITAIGAELWGDRDIAKL